ncbi:MAG: right-handed parallel beta-helix repeat-containing protein [Candidatus Bathyarchaeota archaeon]|nr:right-handed parallel beta-helix repeat-containing protein [Candidatus Bathyarchaeota archaeon]
MKKTIPATFPSAFWANHATPWLRFKQLCTVSFLVFVLLLLPFLVVDCSVLANPVHVSMPQITITKEGISPSNVSIRMVSDNSCVFTGNITGYTIAVECSHMMIDGANFTLRSLPGGDGAALTVRNQEMVTIVNLNVENYAAGITLTCAPFCRLINNNFTNNRYGISLDSSPNLLLVNNTIVGGSVNFGVYAGTFHDYYSNIDESNTINGKPICYWLNRQNAVVPSDVGYLALINCTGITVQNACLSDNGQGALLVGTRRSSLVNCQITGNAQDAGIHIEGCMDLNVSGNDVSQNLKGIVVTDSVGIVISGNNVTSNSLGAIHLNPATNTTTLYGNYIANNVGIALFVEGSCSNHIEANTIEKNQFYALQLLGMQKNNTVYRNNFIGNAWGAPGSQLQVSMPGIDAEHPMPNAAVWDNGEEGNYWSDYTTRYPNATETGNSGFGDTPYNINPNNIDHYPLLQPLPVTPAISVPQSTQTHADTYPGT